MPRRTHGHFLWSQIEFRCLHIFSWTTLRLRFAMARARGGHGAHRHRPNSIAISKHEKTNQQINKRKREKKNRKRKQTIRTKYLDCLTYNIRVANDHTHIHTWDGLHSFGRLGKRFHYYYIFFLNRKLFSMEWLLFLFHFLLLFATLDQSAAWLALTDPQKVENREKKVNGFIPMQRCHHWSMSIPWRWKKSPSRPHMSKRMFDG